MKRVRERYPERHRAKAIQRTANYPKARYAIDAVRNALKRGRLKRQPCEVEGCGKRYTHGHHDDYDKPLEVRWLCPVHHTEWHEKNGPGANIEGQPVHLPRVRRSA